MNDLTKLVLDCGAHESIEHGMCIMEAVSYVAGEPWSDSPRCVSPVLTQFCRCWNDGLPESDRGRLLGPLIPRLIGTCDGLISAYGSRTAEFRRAELTVDWLVRDRLPVLLELSSNESLVKFAARVKHLPEITCTNSGDCKTILHTVLDIARDTGGNRDWNAAFEVAGHAAVNSARYAVWNAAWELSANVIGNAAWNATGYVAATASVAAIPQYVAESQQSAIALLNRMIDLYRVNRNVDVSKLWDSEIGV